MKRYAVFEGRACRSEYWFFNLAMFIIAFCFQSVLNVAGIESSIASTLFQLAFLLPSLAVSVRRLHDTGRSAWNLLWLLLPLAGVVVLLVYYCIGSEGPNRYASIPNPPEA